MSKVITIDGPASSGKGTLSRFLAKSLEFIHLDNGAVFRTIALHLFENNLDLESTPKEVIIDTIRQMEISIDWDGFRCRVLMNGEDNTDKLSSLKIGSLASKLASDKDTFLAMVEITRRIVSDKNIVCDGRAVGTFIFPNANFKFYIDASPEIRAERRFIELKSKGEEVTFDSVLRDIIERDEKDFNRESFPLEVPLGAKVIDTGHSSIEDSLKEMLSLVNMSISEEVKIK